MAQYTLGDIDARVLARLDGNTLLYPTAQRYAEINDALRVVNLFCPFMQAVRAVTGTTVIDQQFYSLPTGMMFPLSVYFNGRQLEKLSIRSASLRYRTWATDRSNRGMPVQEWIPCGFSFFAIHPTDSVGGGSLLVEGVLEPPVLTSSGNSITIQDQYIDIIEKLAAHVLTIKESTAIFSQSSLLYQSFLADMKRMTIWKTVKMPRYFVKMDPNLSRDEQAQGGGG